jgi:6-pyruvoyltetrahydropterin/6-carboxytetrahydropterin synthase
MSWILGKEFTFEAAHKLPNHTGKCFRLHGHTFRMTVYVQGETLQSSGPETGMVTDYAVIKGLVKPILDVHLDHHYLNETTGLKDPTSEALAKWIYDKLEPFLDGLIGIRVDETCTSTCFYSPKRIDLLSVASASTALG